MDVSDIAGAKPKKLYPTKNYGIGSHANAPHAFDNVNMMAAGGLKRQNEAPGSFMKMDGVEYERYQSKQDRNPLNTKDINGDKRNQFGQKMKMPEEPQYSAAQYYNAQPTQQYHSGNENYNPLLSPSMQQRKQELLNQYNMQK